MSEQDPKRLVGRAWKADSVAATPVVPPPAPPAVQFEKRFTPDQKAIQQQKLIEALRKHQQ